MKTCKHGHEYVTLKCGVCRKLSDERCKERVKATKSKHYQENKNTVLSKNKQYRVENAAKINAQRKKYRVDNAASIRAGDAKYRAENADAKKQRDKKYYHDTKEQNKQKTAERLSVYGKNNREKSRALLAKYRAAKIQQTPPWYCHADCVAIYKELKPGYHLDHIIPLRGENVSGLHWHHNLQLLPAAENIAKSNKFDSDSYVHQLPFY